MPWEALLTNRRRAERTRATAGFPALQPRTSRSHEINWIFLIRNKRRRGSVQEDLRRYTDNRQKGLVLLYQAEEQEQSA